MNYVESPTPGKVPVTGGGRSIGVILIDTGRLTLEDTGRILNWQKERGIRFGDAAIELGLLSEADILFALSSQFDYPYLPAGDSSLSQELVAAYKPFMPVVEQLRALRSQLMLRWFDEDAHRQALAVVSPGNGDGRSFIVANLAIVFSQLGARTLVIDADLRRPRQHQLFKLGLCTGLTCVLAGRCGSEAILRVPSLVGLSVLPAGTEPPNPQELLGRPAFTEMLQSISRDYDVVIIDTPAANEYADAQTIAVRAGAALMLARTDQTSIADIVRLTHSLRQSGATLVGSVLNDF